MALDDQIKAKAEQVAGQVQEGVGGVVGDDFS